MELQVYNDQEKQKAIDIINMLDYPIKVKVDNIYKQRTIAQNRYMHMILGMYAKHLGMTPKEMKDEMQKKYLLVSEKTIDGQLFYEVKKTELLDTNELEIFNEDIRRDAMAEHTFYIPMPNETFDDIDETKLKLIK